MSRDLSRNGGFGRPVSLLCCFATAALPVLGLRAPAVATHNLLSIETARTVSTVFRNEAFIVDVDLSYYFTSLRKAWLVVRDSRQTADTQLEEFPPGVSSFDRRVKGYTVLHSLKDSSASRARVFVRGLSGAGTRSLEVVAFVESERKNADGTKRVVLDELPAPYPLQVRVLDEEMRRVHGQVSSSLIESSIDSGAWSKETAIFPLVGQEVSLRVRVPENSRVYWFQIVPDFSTWHRNAGWPCAANAYKPMKVDRIRYARQELREFRDRTRIEILGSPEASRHRGSDALNYRASMGTFWYQVQIVRPDGTSVRSPGLEDATDRGLRSDTFRASIRESEGFLGFLSAFHNVPAVFGSNPYQTGNYLGADCADAIWTAYRRSLGLSPDKADYNVQHLTDKSEFQRITSFELNAGKVDREIFWRGDVRPGDLIAFRYRDKARFQHIAALYSDANQNDVLDADDLVMHTGPMPLIVEPLRGQSAREVLVLRPKTSGAAHGASETLPRHTSTSSDNPWLFPASDRELLQKEELRGLSPEELWRARNEIYARRGLIFSTERGKQLAAKLGGAYRGTTTDAEEIYRRFNETERANVDIIKRVEASIAKYGSLR